MITIRDSVNIHHRLNSNDSLSRIRKHNKLRVICFAENIKRENRGRTAFSKLFTEKGLVTKLITKYLYFNVMLYFTPQRRLVIENSSTYSESKTLQFKMSFKFQRCINCVNDVQCCSVILFLLLLNSNKYAILLYWKGNYFCLLYPNQYDSVYGTFFFF